MLYQMLPVDEKETLTRGVTSAIFPAGGKLIAACKGVELMKKLTEVELTLLKVSLIQIVTLLFPSSQVLPVILAQDARV
ncbi:Uncharacterised protein [uncultured archaeon]|nr:Uncharacterised protein [uncultured archaeon]